MKPIDMMEQIVREVVDDVRGQATLRWPLNPILMIIQGGELHITDIKCPARRPPPPRGWAIAGAACALMRGKDPQVAAVVLSQSAVALPEDPGQRAGVLFHHLMEGDPKPHESTLTFVAYLSDGTEDRFLSCPVTMTDDQGHMELGEVELATAPKDFPQLGHIVMGFSKWKREAGL